MKVLTAHDFAEAFGIGERAAQKAFKKETWRGQSLPIVDIPNRQGGQSGRVYGLVLDAAPDAIRTKLNAYLGIDEAPVEQVLKGSYQERQFEDQAVRYGIIEPILATQARTAERAEAFRTVAGQLHIYKGVPTKLAEPTLREWVRKYEVKGLKRYETLGSTGDML